MTRRSLAAYLSVGEGGRARPIFPQPIDVQTDGDANVDLVAVSVFGNANSLAALSAFGDANPPSAGTNALLTASGAGNASSGSAGGVAASATGDADGHVVSVAPDGSAQGDVLVVSWTGLRRAAWRRSLERGLRPGRLG